MKREPLLCHALITVEVHLLKKDKMKPPLTPEKNVKCSSQIVSHKRDKYTHSCGNLNGVLNKLMCLLHHSCREVSNDAHLVHVPRTVNLAEK